MCLKVLRDDFEGERTLMLNNDAVQVHIFREDDLNTVKWSECGRGTMATIQLTDIRDLPAGGPLGRSKRQINPLVQYIVLSLEVNQAGNSLLLSLSLLAVCTNVFVASPGRCAI
jgi:hypothetical protein